MQLLNYLKPLQQPLRQMEVSFRDGRAVAYMDSCISYVTRPHAEAQNPALGIVRWPVVFGFWIIAAFLFVTLVWGALVPIESAVGAHGSVVLFSSKKTVQHLEGGIIDEILVKDGDKVKAGQVLIRLRDTASNASRDAVRQQLFTERASEARLKAERDNKDVIIYDEDMLTKANADKVLAEILTTQQHLFESERGAQTAKLNELNQRVAQAHAEIDGLQAESTGAEEQIALLGKEIGTVEELLAKGYATETRLLALKRNQSELAGRKGQFQAEMAKTQQLVTEAENAVVNQQKEFETKYLQELHETQLKVTELQNKLLAAEDVQGRTVITAPSEGIVTGLRFHTAGGVINPGMPIMDVIPQSDSLIVEVHVKPSDISAIHQGMDARVLFTSYKMRTTPKVPGKVTQISADVITDEHAAQPNSYYTARVEVDKDFLHSLTKPIELQPGMPAEVMIRTGSRSFIGYLFKPVADSMYKAFREQ